MKKFDNIIRRALLDKKGDFDPDAMWNSIADDIEPKSKGIDYFSFLLGGLFALSFVGIAYFCFVDKTQQSLTINDTKVAIPLVEEIVTSTEKEIKTKTSEITKDIKTIDNQLVNNDASINKTQNGSTEKAITKATKTKTTAPIYTPTPQTAQVQVATKTKIKSPITENKSNAQKSSTKVTIPTASSAKQTTPTSNAITSNKVVSTPSQEKKTTNTFANIPIPIKNSTAAVTTIKSNPSTFIHSMPISSLSLIKSSGMGSGIRLPRLPKFTNPIKGLRNVELQFSYGLGVMFSTSQTFRGNLQFPNPNGSLSSYFVVSNDIEMMQDAGIELSFGLTERLSLRSGFMIQEKRYSEFVIIDGFVINSFNTRRANYAIPLIINYNWRGKKWQPFVGGGLIYSFNPNNNALLSATVNQNCITHYSEFNPNNAVTHCPTFRSGGSLGIAIETGTSFPLFKQKFSFSVMANFSTSESYFSEVYKSEVLNPFNLVGYTNSYGSYVNLRLKYHLPLAKK